MSDYNPEWKLNHDDRCPTDDDKESVKEGLRQSWQDVQAGRTHDINEWCNKCDKLYLGCDCDSDEDSKGGA